MQKTRNLGITVNGRLSTIEISPSSTLLEVLRDKLKLTGTKEGCKTGNCGACTVLLDGKPVYSCLLPALKAENRHILTIEGLGRPGDLHPVQKAFLDHGAVQCGYCTPGMILSVKGLLDEKRNPDTAEIKTAVSGNLCRCGNYIQIVEAVKALSDKPQGRHKNE